ncbi:EXS family-domain-containing protein [Syncephalis plumigaleata]|nr:EXS family-domain-containing protein [Syncephalis plumigaleata]
MSTGQVQPPQRDDNNIAAAVISSLAGMDSLHALTTSTPSSSSSNTSTSTTSYLDLSDWDPFPIPFRILFLICFGIWAWGSNISLLSWTGIDAGRLLAVSGEKGLRYTKVYQLAAALSTVTLLGWCAFLVTQSDTAISLVYVGFFLLVVNPMDGWCRRERFRFLKSLGRIFFGALGTTVYLSDVILADILTSFAKVFADLYATLCHIVVLGGIDLSAPGLVTGNSCGYHWFGPGLTALPYALRFKQCLVEYVHSPEVADQRRHLANALKYASAFPVIFLSAVQQLRHRNPDTPHTDVLADIVTDDLLPTVWFTCVLINSLYSFYWDVTIDWHLGQLGPFSATTTVNSNNSNPSTEYHTIHHQGYTPITSMLSVHPNPFSSSTRLFTLGTAPTRWPEDSKHAKLLRPILHFGEPFIYYMAITLDFLLRFTWSLKLSTHLRLDELTAGGFALEWLEVVRRWLWVYFRLEREWVVRGYANSTVNP